MLQIPHQSLECHVEWPGCVPGIVVSVGRGRERERVRHHLQVEWMTMTVSCTVSCTAVSLLLLLLLLLLPLIIKVAIELKLTPKGVLVSWQQLQRPLMGLSCVAEDQTIPVSDTLMGQAHCYTVPLPPHKGC